MANVHTGLDYHAAVDADSFPNPGFQNHAPVCLCRSVARVWCSRWRLGVDTGNLNELRRSDACNELGGCWSGGWVNYFDVDRSGVPPKKGHPLDVPRKVSTFNISEKEEMAGLDRVPMVGKYKTEVPTSVKSPPNYSKPLEDIFQALETPPTQRTVPPYIDIMGSTSSAITIKR